MLNELKDVSFQLKFIRTVTLEIRHFKGGIIHYLMRCPEALASLTQFVPGMVTNDSLCPEELACLHWNLQLWVSLHTLFLTLKLLPVLQSPEIRLERPEIVCGSSF